MDFLHIVIRNFNKRTVTDVAFANASDFQNCRDFRCSDRGALMLWDPPAPSAKSVLLKDNPPLPNVNDNVLSFTQDEGCRLILRGMKSVGLPPGIAFISKDIEIIWFSFPEQNSNPPVFSGDFPPCHLAPAARGPHTLFAVRRSALIPFSMRCRRTVVALTAESSQLDGNCRVAITTLSVYPFMLILKSSNSWIISDISSITRPHL